MGAYFPEPSVTANPAKLVADVDLNMECKVVFGPNPEWVKVWLSLREDKELQPIAPLEQELYEAITKNFIALAQKMVAFGTREDAEEKWMEKVNKAAEKAGL